MTALHDRWRDGLEAEALIIDVPVTVADPAGVVRRGHRRHRRNQTAAVVTVAALLAGSGLAWKADHDRPARPTKLVVADDSTTGDPLDGGGPPTTGPVSDGVGLQADPASLPPVDLVASPLAWRAQDVAYGHGVSGHWFGPAKAGPAGLVTVSTRPGVRAPGDETLAFYMSPDGLAWSKGGELTGRHWFGDVTATERGLVAVGTAAATGRITVGPGGQGTGDVVVAVSTNGGDTFRDIVLPLDLRGVKAAAAAGPVPMNVGVGTAKVVVGAAGTMVAVEVVASPTIDLRDRLPVGVSRAARTMFSAAGLVVFKQPTDPTREPVAVDRVVPWSDLGVDPAVAAFVGGSLHLFRASDGETFEEVPAPADAVGVQQLVTTPDGFALQATVRQDGAVPGQAPAVWSSSDGLTWSPTEPLPFDQSYGPPTLGSLGGRLVAVGTYRGWPAVAVAEGSGWKLTPLGNGVAPAGVAVSMNQVAIGAGGIGIGLDTYVDPVAGLVSHAGGYTLRVDGVTRGIAVIEDATGKELARFADLNNPGSSSVLKPVYDASRQVFDGPVLTTVPPTTVVGPGGQAGSGTAMTPPDPARYVVRVGDTWVGIAAAAAVSPDALASLNPGLDVNRLVPGDVVVLPAASRATSNGPASAAQATTTTMLGIVGGPVGVGRDMPIGAVGLQVLDPTTGAALATFDLSELRDRYARATNGVARPAHGALLLTSTNAVAWSSVDLAVLAGAPVDGITGVFSTPAGLVATVMMAEADPAAPAPGDGTPGPIKRQRALVGALRSP